MPDLPDYYTQTSVAEAEAARFKGGLDANKSATPVSRDIYMATDTHILYVCIVDGAWTGFDAATLTQGILTLYANMAGGGFQIKNIANPTAAQDAATRAYVLARCGLYLPLTGGTMTGNILMVGNKITGLGDPTLNYDAANKRYVDNLLALYLLLTGGELSGNLTIKKATPELILEDTETDGQTWSVGSWVYAGKGWFRIHNEALDIDFYISEDGWLDCVGQIWLHDTGEEVGHYPTLILEAVGTGLKNWYFENTGIDVVIRTSGAGAISLPSGMRVKTTSILTSDHTCSGSSAILTAGTALTVGQAVYVGDDSKMELADKDLATTMPAIALVTPATIAENAVGEFLMQGFFRDDTWNWTPGGILYVGDDGALVQDVSGYTTGDQVQVVGVAISADIIHFNPSLELVEIS